jgi:hypothetical protein
VGSDLSTVGTDALARASLRDQDLPGFGIEFGGESLGSEERVAHVVQVWLSRRGVQNRRMVTDKEQGASGGDGSRELGV